MTTFTRQGRVTKPMDVKEEVRESKHDAFLDYVLTTSMSPDLHIPCLGRVLKLRTDDTVPNAMRRLAVEGFTSAPVVSDNGYEGWVDMLDMVKFVSRLFWGQDTTAWANFWDTELKFQRATLSDVMGKRMFHLPPPPIFEDNSTMHALELMVTNNVHRLAILDNRLGRRLTGIFTQSMLLSELQQRVWMLGELRYKTVDDMIGEGHTGRIRRVTTVLETDKAINAFNVMSQQEFSGLAVVDGDGVLTGAISVTDLKCVGANGEHFARLFKTVQEFKTLVRDEFPLAAPRSHFSRKPVPLRGLYVSPANTFEDVIRLMDDGNIHRVFVCTEESVKRLRPEPTHVITQSDVLRQIWSHYTLSLV